MVIIDSINVNEKTLTICQCYVYPTSGISVTFKSKFVFDLYIVITCIYNLPHTLDEFFRKVNVYSIYSYSLIHMHYTFYM